MRLLLWIIIACCASFPADASSPFANIMSLNGRCVQLVIGNEDLSERCAPKLIHTAVNAQNIDFYFETNDKRLYVFNGTDGENPSPDTDVSNVKTVVINTNGESVTYPALGRCSYGNPYKGRMTLSCSGTLTDGRRFDATFITDGQKPETLNAGTGNSPSSITQVQTQPQNPPLVQQGGVEQGYASKPEFGKISKIQLEAIETFTLNVCNRTGRKIMMAFHTKYNNLLIDEDHAVHGWYTAPAQKCTEIGTFTPTDFAFYANNENGREWTGDDYSICVESERFKRIVYKETKCAKALRKGFTALEINSKEYTLNLR